MRKIAVSHLGKSFGKQEVLKDIELTMESGKIYGISGYNGSGKTVLFKCICGLLFPDKGSVFLDGRERKKGEILQEAGVIIEGPAYLKGASAYQNLRLLYEINNRPDKEHLFEVLRMVGLDPDLRRPVGKYSLGMKQRLGIAQAVMEDPDILILDEPMNGLDKQGVQDMRKLFLEMKEQGKLILLASHNKYDMELLCDELYELDNGRLEKQSSEFLKK